MVKRDELLAVVDKNSEEDLIEFVKQCKSHSAACLAETFGSCSKKQLDHVWQKTQAIVMERLIGVQADQQTDNQDSDTVSRTVDVTQCLVTMLTTMMTQKDVYVPEAMFQTACLVQDVIPSLPLTEDKVKNNVVKVFEEWWKKNLHGKESLIITSFLYLLERSLDLQPKPLIADVKRVWSLHEVVTLVELHNESSDDFKNLLQRCFISPQYMQQDEGIKFLGFILSIDERFTDLLHGMIKNHLLSVPRSWHEKYGQIYFRAWQRVTGSFLQNIEQNCIQDLMVHAVNAQAVLAPALEKLLGYFHKQKKQRGVDEMLYRLYEPIMWRSLKVANSQVRANAATLFFDVFPLQNQEFNVKDTNQLLQKQFDLFQELLYDPFPNIRSISVMGVFRVMKVYWEAIPQDTLKNLTVKLIQDLRCDSSSSDVRERVIKGLALLLDNHLCHLFLKPVLPEIRNSFHDVSEKVRVAMLELLIKVKSLRTIKSLANSLSEFGNYQMLLQISKFAGLHAFAVKTYWTIVPMEHLLARLVVDSDPVNRRIVKLIFNSFIPLEATGEAKLDRCAELIQANPGAARQFFRYTPKHMSIDETVSYMCLLCKAILLVIKKRQDMDSETGTDGDQENDDEGDLQLSDTPTMLGLCEAICILWTVSDDSLKKASNAHLKKNLQKKFSYALTEMMGAFTDPQILCVLVQIAGYLPAGYIPTVSRTWLPKLRKMTSENVEDDYGVILESLCVSNRGPEIVELASDWLESVLVQQKGDVSSSKIMKKNKKKVGFVDPHQPQPQLALDFLSYIFKHRVTQEIFLRNHLKEMDAVRDLLRGSLRVIEIRLGENTDDLETGDDNFLSSAFSLYCISLLLHLENNSAMTCIPECVYLLSWSKKHVLPMLKVKFEEDEPMTRKRHGSGNHGDLAHDIIQSLLNIMSNMLLVGIGNNSVCEKVIDFCITCLTTDDELHLLPDVLLCLYQVTEFSKYSLKSDDTDSGCHGDMIPQALSKIFVKIASSVKNYPSQSVKVLGKVKGHIIELMKVVFQGQSQNDLLLHEVMATIMAAILAEMTFHSQQYDLEDVTTVVTLPPLSAWLVDILQKRTNITKYFIKELTDCCESGAVTGVHSLHGVIHLLSCLTKCKQEKLGLKELWTVIHTQTDRQTRELSNEDQDTIKDVILSIENKLKGCQTALNMVPP